MVHLTKCAHCYSVFLYCLNLCHKKKKKKTYGSWRLHLTWQQYKNMSFYWVLADCTHTWTQTVPTNVIWFTNKWLFWSGSLQRIKSSSHINKQMTLMSLFCLSYQIRHPQCSPIYGQMTLDWFKSKQCKQSHWQTKDSYELVLFSKSKTHSITSVVTVPKFQFSVPIPVKIHGSRYQFRYQSKTQKHAN